ncbi:NAD(P)/FAD-dependent oxidoreductase [Streptosporangium lutulentum]
MYGASEGLSTVMLDAVALGGQAGTSSCIENYLGFPLGISGAELTERAVVQAEKFGASFGLPAEAAWLERRDGHYTVGLGEGPPVHGRTVIIATGARYRSGGAEAGGLRGQRRVLRRDPGRGRALQGRTGRGGGRWKLGYQATIFLSEHASSVRLLIRGEALEQDMSHYLTDRIKNNPRVDVMLHTEVCKLVGTDGLEAVIAENNQTGERTRLLTRAMFVFIGADPCTAWLAPALALDDKGFVLTGFDDGLPLETSLPGVFAAGDVRSQSVKRVASAVGEGAMAVRLVHEHVAREASQPLG